MSTKQRIYAMLDAHSDLHMAAVITAIAEGEMFRTSRGRKFANRLAKMAEQQRRQQFATYERLRIALAERAR